MKRNRIVYLGLNPVFGEIRLKPVAFFAFYYIEVKNVFYAIIAGGKRDLL